MLGFSLGKLLVLFFAILLVWYGFKYVSKVGEVASARVAKKADGAKAEPANAIEAEDMVKCTVCGAFVAATGATACDKEACPYPA